MRVTTDLGQLVDFDLVIESVVEDLAVKQDLFARARQRLQARHHPGHEHLDLAGHRDGDGDRAARQVCGVHFFNPAPAMSLVEVVRPITASDETIEAVTEFARVRQGAGRGQGPGRLHRQRPAVPVLNNAVRLLEQGVATKEGIDTAMKGGCGFPMGPFALLDLVGLDTSLAILDALYEEYRDPNYAPVPLLRRMVSAGQLGRKTKQGFYDYKR